MKKLIHIIAGIFLSEPSAAKGRLGQLMLNLGTKRPFNYSFMPESNAVVLEFKKTHPDELKALEQYDERLIKRVIIKNLGPAGTEVLIVLKDRKLRSSVYELFEPYRVAVDFFDADYSLQKDPITGMPLVLDPDDLHSRKPARPESINQLNIPPQVQDAVRPAEQHPDSPSLYKFEKKQLLLPHADEKDQNSFYSGIHEAPEGEAKSWKTYPPYIYRLQTAAYEHGLQQDKEIPPQPSNMSSAASIANYAGKLFNLSHESKALVAYQQVLHKDPSIFEKDALHLWKFAESHLAHGNLTLARGYYQAIIEKHPESPLSRFAQLRALDIAAIRLVSQGKTSDISEIATRLDSIKPRSMGELSALIALRKAYWSDKNSNLNNQDIPLVEGDIRKTLSESYPNTESSRTAFLAGSLILRDMVRDDREWNQSYGNFADSYFKRFSGPSSEPQRSELKDLLHKKLSKNLQNKLKDGKTIDLISDYEALSPALRSISKDPKNAWALAEAYRASGQKSKAADFYAIASKNLEDGIEKFRTNFWLSIVAGENAIEIRERNGSQSEAERYQKQSRSADKESEKLWTKLNDNEKNQLMVSLKDVFEKTISDSVKLRTPAKIVLSSWTRALSTKISSPSADAQPDWQKNFSPSTSTIILLTNLAKRFSEMGMDNERKEALNLLKLLKPKDLEDDKAAKETWTKELMNLAEDYRKSSNYLEAGRLYDLVGRESENNPDRAETLYKAGLLLFRSGRREEAVNAFRDAAADGNNLFYANLAKERLSQIDQEKS